MKDITNTVVTGEDGVVMYADGSKEEFQCSRAVATIIVSLTTALEKERKMRIATGDRLHRMYTRDSDMILRGLNSMSATPTAPTATNAEFMRLVRAVTPRYDSAPPDTDPRIVALDVLCYAPAEAFSAVHPIPTSGIQLNQAIDILEQVGDYMKANNIAPKIISTGSVTRSISVSNATFWGKKH